MTSEETTFWISFISITSGVIVLALKMCFKSKCDSVKCFCFELHRNTEQETDIEMPPTPSNNRSNNL